jgi:hypothetical protein
MTGRIMDASATRLVVYRGNLGDNDVLEESRTNAIRCRQRFSKLDTEETKVGQAVAGS